MAVVEGVDKWVEERSRGQGSGCMRQSICKTYGPNMRKIWTRCSVAMLMDARPNNVSGLPPEESACHGLRQVMVILSSFELSRHLPTPIPDLHPATSPTHDKWPVFHSKIILLMAHSFKTLISISNLYKSNE